jgi:hypothetical protein
VAPGAAVPFSVPTETLPPGLEPFFYLDAGVTPPGSPTPQFVDLPLTAYQNDSTYTPFPINGGNYLTLGIGEIRNNTTSPLLANVVAVTRDASGRVLATNSGDDLCDVAAAPGGFTIGVWNLYHAQPSNPTPVLTIQALRPRNNSRIVLSTTSLTKASSAGGLLTISGKIKNTSSQTLDFLHVCAIAYNANGDVIGALGDTLFPAGGLAPDASTNFTIRDVPAVGIVDEVKAIADGVVPQ